MQNTSTNPAQIALDQLQVAFVQWRQQKTHSQAKIPLDLLEKARDLSDHFDDQTIRQKLGITSRQLQRIKSLKANPADPEPHFVEVTNTISPKPPLTISISLPNGLSVNISGFGSQPVSQIIDHIISGYQSC